RRGGALGHRRAAAIRRHPPLDAAGGGARGGLHLPDGGGARQLRPRRRMTALFSLRRFGAVLAKEFIQMRRDHVTFAMMIGLPIMQLLLFGFIINSDARNLPTLVEMGDDGPLTRAIVSGMQNSTYFDFQGAVAGAAAGEAALRGGSASFVVVTPQDFERD